MVEFYPVVAVGASCVLIAIAFFVAARRTEVELDQRKYRVAGVTMLVAATVVSAVAVLLIQAGPPPS